MVETTFLSFSQLFEFFCQISIFRQFSPSKSAIKWTRTFSQKKKAQICSFCRFLTFLRPKTWFFPLKTHFFGRNNFFQLCLTFWEFLSDFDFSPIFALKIGHKVKNIFGNLKKRQKERSWVFLPFFEITENVFHFMADFESENRRKIEI